MTKIAASPPIEVGGSLFTAEQLAAVAAAAGPEGRVEMTPFKQLYVEIPAERRAEAEAKLAGAGLEVYLAGFATKSLIACNFCKGAEEAGLETARAVNRAIAGIPAPTPLRIGYAGCALGTSEPLLKDIGIVKMRDSFDLYVGGDPKGLKASTARLLVSGLKEERLVPAVTALVDYYRTNAKGKEKFGKFVDRVSLDTLRELVG
ncbi:nitrite reductase [Paenibacillus sp.]|uniref:nitrite reductase n=1 Tax=Paenibacillus sp. TaxID=58172 RepID=UPI002D501E9C|nr:nitrite reductase [Paenibacillus sp.]HZG85651.1 nitrite reductase [Paenibacillus sp.]